MNEMERFEGNYHDLMNTVNELKDGIWCVRTIRNGKHYSFLAENVEEYPQAFSEAQLLPLKNNIAKAVYKVIMGLDDNERLTVKKITDAVFKSIREELVYKDTQVGEK